MKNHLTLREQSTGKEIGVDVSRVFNAGYAGSDQAKVQEHIDELAKLGVPTPETTPTLYPIANNNPTTDETIQVQHGETSGEIEYVLIWAEGELYVTVGSDHTDRRLETFSVPMSKQAYPNIIARDVWKYSDVKDHWDQITFTCWASSGEERELYQQGKVTDLMTPEEWEPQFESMQVNRQRNFFFSATINTVAKSLAFAEYYEFELHDPVRDQTIRHAYKVEQLQKPIE